MAAPLLNALFALGIYVGSPNGSDPSAEQAFEQGYASFVSTTGVNPAYVSVYLDNSQPIDAWVGNAGWVAWSTAQSPVANKMIPVVSLQLCSTDGSDGTSEAQFQAFAAGQYDSTVSEIVDVWNNNGFDTLIVRLGVEMNIQSIGYAGDSAESQAAWVAAFQHVAGVLRHEARAHNMKLKIVWNPDTTNYTNASATNALYPGDQYVDIIGADMYADMYPYNDTFNPPTYHDWDTGGEDTSIAEFVADYINRAHYWSWPAADINCLDCSEGHSQSLDSLIAFAELHHKPFAIPEAGAGNSNGNVDVNDDANFPMWLTQELTTAQAAGLKIAFVTVWDNNGNGNYEFSYAADSKPQEAASWAKYFGVQPAVTSLGNPAPVVVGQGPGKLALRMAEDSWQGDAQYTLSIDGQPVGATMTQTASYTLGQRQDVVVRGTWAAGPHTLSIDYTNDANGGTSVTDRNLYLTGVSYNGVEQPDHRRYMFAGGVQSIVFNVPAS